MDDEAFAKRIVRSSTECDIWVGKRSRQGYGLCLRAGRWVAVHRVAWELANGPIPDGLFVCHHCDNPPCVKTEPDEIWPNGHLFLGTAADNAHDRDSKGRQSQGHNHAAAKLSEDQARVIIDRLASGQSRQSLAQMYAVTETCIRDIANLQTWKFLPRPTASTPYRMIGSRHPNSKFSEADVIEIRRLSANGLSTYQLGAQFGVTRQAISLIINRKAWRHV